MILFKNINLKKATSSITSDQVLSSLSLNDIGICFRDESFQTDIGIMHSRPIQGTHWVLYFDECYFDSYGITPPKKLSRFIIKRNGPCSVCNYKIQGLTSDK